MRRPHTCGTTTTTGSVDWFWGRAGPGGFVCLEEHRPGLRRDDGDEAEHEVHFRAHLGDVELVLADEGRVDRGYEVDDRRDTVRLPDVGLAEEARLWTVTGEWQGRVDSVGRRAAPKTRRP